MSCVSFYDSWSAYLDGKISWLDHLGKSLDHLFEETQHPRNQNVNQKEITFWAERDLVSAAIMLCMLNGSIRLPSPVRQPLTNMILGSKTSTLEELRSMDQEEVSVLAVPLLCQILVAAALQQGNRAVVREFISTSPPPPRHDLLFGCDKGPTAVVDPSQQDFGESKARGHGALAGQPDNGCDLWADMIRAGWAIPRQYMQTWAASSASTDAGKKLFDTLVDHGIEIEVWAPRTALMYAKLELLEYALSLFTPTNDKDCYDLLSSAAFIRPNGVKYFELLHEHGVRNINWREPPTSGKYMPIRREDLVPGRTPLHIAAGNGDPEVVDWLLQHGAEPLLDYFRMDAREFAAMEGRQDVIAVFERYPDWHPKEEVVKSRRRIRDVISRLWSR